MTTIDRVKDIFSDSTVSNEDKAALRTLVIAYRNNPNETTTVKLTQKIDHIELTSYHIPDVSTPTPPRVRNHFQSVPDYIKHGGLFIVVFVTIWAAGYAMYSMSETPTRGPVVNFYDIREYGVPPASVPGTHVPAVIAADVAVMPVVKLSTPPVVAAKPVIAPATIPAVVTPRITAADVMSSIVFSTEEFESITGAYLRRSMVVKD